MLDDLQTAIAEAPDDATPYLVYADWLESQGDPHGEYIHLMHALEGETDAGRFLARKKRVDHLRAENEHRWLSNVKLHEAEWRWGFVRRARLEAGALRPFVQSRVGHFPRQLALVGNAATLGVALESLPFTVSALRLEPTLSAERLALPEAVLTGLPLTTLSLGAAQWQWPVGGPTLVNLRELHLEAAGPEEDPALLAFLDRAAHLRSLTLLDVPGALEPLVTVERFPRLGSLHLREDLADDALEHLAHSPLLARLDSLTLGGPFTDRGFEAVLREFVRFSRLKAMSLYGGTVSAQLRSLARKQLTQLTLSKSLPKP